MPEHDPGLIEQQVCRLPAQRALETAEQVEQDRDQVPLAHRHQILDLEDQEVPLRQAVMFGVEQPAERAFQRVVAQR